MSLGTVPTVLPGLDEALYREAEERRQRQARREEEAISVAKRDSRPRLSQNSLALCQARLERELRAAFTEAGGAGGCLPRERVPQVLEVLGLLRGEERENAFCSKLALVLDKDDTGSVSFERLFAFLLRSLNRDAEGTERRRSHRGSRAAMHQDLDDHVFGGAGSGGSSGGEGPQHMSLEEECFTNLERHLSRAFGRLLANRLSRPRAAGESPSRAGGSAVRQRPHGQALHVTGAPSPAALMRSLAASSPCCASQAVSPQIVLHTPPHPPPQQKSTSSLPGQQGTPRSRADSTPRHSTPRRVHSSAEVGKEWRAEAEALASSRCNLLYQQALFASRENAQLEEEIKALKEQEEMRECTFRPKTLNSRRAPSPRSKPQPRNFDATVARMRSAHNQRMETRGKLENIPRGENYERLRRMGSKPFSFNCKDRVGANRRPLLMFVDVNVGKGRTGRIGVHYGDDLRVLCQNFAKTFTLDADATMKLENMLRQAVENVEIDRLERDDNAGSPSMPGRPFGLNGHASSPAFAPARHNDELEATSTTVPSAVPAPTAGIPAAEQAAMNADMLLGGDTRPEGPGARTVTVTILGAHDLPLANGFFDVYCTCEVPGRPHMKVRTAATSSSSAPVWDHTGPQVVLSASESLLFCIWEGGPAAAGAERLLGEAYIAGQDMAPSTQRQAVDLPLEGVGGRHVGVLSVRMLVESLSNRPPDGQLGQVPEEHAVMSHEPMGADGGLDANGSFHSSANSSLHSGGSASLPMDVAHSGRCSSNVARPAARTSGSQGNAGAGTSFDCDASTSSVADEVDLEVIVLSAHGLANVDGFAAGVSDPFCICKVINRDSPEFQTKVVSNSLEPTWEHKGEVRGFRSEDALQFEVWDANSVRSDKILGRAVLESCHFLPHGSVQTEVMLLSDKKPAGTLKVQVRIKRGSGQVPLKVTVVGARGLPITDGYCTCSVAGRSTTEFRTPTVNRCAEPIWDFTREVSFSTTDPAIEFQVWDSGDSKAEVLVGSAVLAACHFLPHGGIETELLLRSERQPSGVGTLSVRIEVSPLHVAAVGPYGGHKRSKRPAWSVHLQK